MKSQKDSETCISVVMFLLHAKQQIASIASEFGLTGMQALTLLMIDNDQPRSMNSFCKLFVCDASNVTGIIDGLEQKKLVSRQNHPKDRRIKVIQLEQAGAKLRRQIIIRLNEACDGLFSPLGSEKQQVIDAIHNLGQNGISQACPMIAI